MSRPIFMSDEIIAQTLEDMKQKLITAKMTDGVFKYTNSFTYEEHERAQVVFEPMAYVKMMCLVAQNKDEVGWHGTVERVGDDPIFRITDILVYPQEVTGVTVTPDQEEYQTWLMELDDEVFNKLHFQAHSHVEMGVSPSTTDLAHQESIVAQLRPDKDFYIFLIINKRHEVNFKIYDMPNNILYESADIDMKVDGGELDMQAFLKDAASKVTRRTFNTYNNGYSYNDEFRTTAADRMRQATNMAPANRKGLAEPAMKPARGRPKKDAPKAPKIPKAPKYDDVDQIDFDDYIFNNRMK